MRPILPDDPNEPQDDSDTPDWMRDLHPVQRRDPELPRPAQPANNPQPAPTPQPRDTSKWGRLAIELFGAEFLEISCLLNLLRPPIWEGWIHDPHKGGWYNPSTKAFMSYAGARIVIANRISELGLSPERVYAYPHTVPPGENWREQHEEWKRFNRLNFEEQMDTFRQKRAHD